MAASIGVTPFWEDNNQGDETKNMHWSRLCCDKVRTECKDVLLHPDTRGIVGPRHGVDEEWARPRFRHFSSLFAADAPARWV